ncbi:biogenesis protein MshI [Shewanella sp. OMA3-2]|uniref:biogenesis protein MshI n=1 Tax=Shewanella sp. OMA3-2 TaxID=2908650 RepID=UPI001F3DB9CC|nr:biogenesis protein MshI [Shewanella sp. OMA3-2]UJF21992.1 biogenesis protein MshI [Shewanella sp. OMA3-2]
MNSGFVNKLAFWRPAEVCGKLGVFVDVDSVWVYQAEMPGQPESYTEFPLVKKSWNNTFSAIKQKFGAATVQIVMSASHYQLLQADKPNVEAAEINQALIWAVKDMASEPVANIHLDYFESSVAASTKINVVIVARDKLVAIASACEELGLAIAGITIEELVLTHLFDADNMAHMLVTHLPHQELLFTVIKAGESLMQRRVRGFNELQDVKEQDLSSGLADNLSLEIQRSMDYFESQLRQAPVSAINLLTEGEQAALAKLVAANFNQSVSMVEHQGVAAYLAKLAFVELSRSEA